MADNKKIDETKTIISELQKLKADNTILKKAIGKTKSARGPFNSSRPKLLGKLQTLQVL